MNESAIWVFVGDGSKLPCGVFYCLDTADKVIGNLKLSGLLTSYPIGMTVYEWAIAKAYFRPSRNSQEAPSFIQQFSSASLDHFHYLDGNREG